jgi:hypothetical protein
MGDVAWRGWQAAAHWGRCCGTCWLSLEGVAAARQPLIEEVLQHAGCGRDGVAAGRLLTSTRREQELQHAGCSSVEDGGGCRRLL